MAASCRQIVYWSREESDCRLRIFQPAYLTARAAVSITRATARGWEIWLDGVAGLEHGHLRPGAPGHPPRALGVERAVLGGEDGVARLVVPGGDSQLGVEGP
jgi:hypothetical protein